jgi:hypothetical protein
MKNMIEVYRYTGDKEEAAFWCDKLATWYKEANDNANHSLAVNRAKRLRQGEPLNRIVVQIANHIYEVEEITADMKKDIKYAQCNVIILSN